MFRKSEKVPSIPAWDPVKTVAPSGPEAPGTIPVFAQAAVAGANGKSPTEPFDIVLEAVKDELKTSRRLAPSAYDNPSDEDYAIVMQVAREQIQVYNVNAPSRGQAMLVDIAEAEVVAELERLAKRMTEDVLGWGPIAPYMDDPAVEEIYINGYNTIFIQRAGCLPER
ncbi:MAG TPA: hypothetical protein VGK87_05005, partial [Anaerolineae bacterium]